MRLRKWHRREGESVNVLSLCNGCGMLRPALDKAGIEVANYYSSEIDKYACQIANKNYPDTVQLGDVNDWQAWDLPKIELLTAGFPCFVAGTKVITKDAYKNIEHVVIGDKVLTHKNRWRKVVDFGCCEAPTIMVYAQGMKPTETTAEHPYYVRKKNKKWNNEKRKYETYLTPPKWVEAERLDKGDYVGLPILNTSENELNITNEEAWVIGRYIADGHTIKTRRKSEGRPNERNWGVVLSVGKEKSDAFKSDCKLSYCFHKHTQSTFRAVISSKRLVEIVEKHCGCGSENKHFSMMLLNLPKELLEIVLDGYFAGDGCVIGNSHKATSISEELILTLNLAIAKVYRVNSSYEYVERPKKTVICGRTVNQKDTYSTVHRKVMLPSSKAIVDVDTVWLPIKKVKETGNKKIVYNMTVDEDNTYTANNIIVHNCQDLSCAGKQQGLNGERSGLLYEVLKIRDALKPKYFLFENVASMNNHWRDEITQLVGVNPVELNSKYWGAQNRARLFWTNIPGAKNIEMMQVRNDKKIYLKDILIDDFVTPAVCSDAPVCMGNVNPSGKGMNGNVYSPFAKAPTLTTNKGEGIKIAMKSGFRKLHPVECERLMNLPDGYTEGVSNSQRYKMIGNGWDVHVMAGLLMGIVEPVVDIQPDLFSEVA